MKIFSKTPFLIADIGFNFFDVAEKEGISDIDAAKLMIDEAKSCGVDAVMFQSYKSENVVSSSFPNYWDSSQDPIDSQFELFKKFDRFGVDEFMSVFKISSSDLTNIPFIKYVAGKNKPILLSTGASTIKEIKDAVKAIEEVSTVDIAIMHCVLSHPTAFEDANLSMINDLSSNFPDYEVGYSDHTKSDENMMVLTTAYNYGATIIEKHFTLDKSLPGNDHCYAMDSKDVGKFKSNIDFLSKISGYKHKQLLICESSTRKETRRSIVAKNDIGKGSVISQSDIAFKRPGTGISPADVDDVIGKVANVDISKDTLIAYEMLNS